MAKPFCDLSLATMLVLEQSLSLTVLVIIILGEQKDKLPGKDNKDNKSVVKTPSSISMVKTNALSGATLQNLNPSLGASYQIQLESKGCCC